MRLPSTLRPEAAEVARAGPRFRGSARPLSVGLVLLLALAAVPRASAHGGTHSSGLSQWHGLAVVALGVAGLVGSVLLKRRGRLRPTTALYGVLAGLVVAAFGTVLWEGLLGDPSYTAQSMPFPRSWYRPLSLSVGLAVSVASLVVGWLRWPTRPRYTFLGILMGLWISYPELVPGPAGYTHPLGYLVVLATPVLVGYIVWTDAGDVLASVLRDPVARRFGLGVGLVVAVFFMATSGFVTVFWEEGAPHETTVEVLPVVYQLVQWPTLEVALPDVPLFFAFSAGIAIVVGLLSGLIGLNAALIARQWRLGERAGGVEGTAGTGVVVGSCTCGCCGPLVAKVAVLAAGPSVAAPIYWVFVDTASPLSSLFIVASVVLFTASLVYSVESARRVGGQSASGLAAD
ncbi:hypothetical protein [Halorussus sp. AFM4]|uniref:hypothetical protein n=1 Tax=Halorussus sp. AFM4 TaxID=3421651 RepID=UPI003EBB5C57